MEKKKTPVSTVIFYILGIIFLIVAAFMLWTAVNYTKTYLDSYDAAFKDMWTNSVQYIIAQFVPYLGMGVICLGLGRAIKGTANVKVAQQAAAPAGDSSAKNAPAAAETAEENAAEEEAAAALPAAEELANLARRIDTNRKVLSIKIEEKEKRDSFRIKELEKKVEGFLSDVKYINEPLEELVYKQAAGDALTEPAEEAAEAAAPAEAAEEAKPAGAVPQIFRMARAMTMPQCPAAEAAEAAEAVEAEESAGAVPPVFRVARNMTMPQCPR